MLSDKKAAKKIIKLAKCCPEYYTSEEVMYAKIYKKSLNKKLMVKFVLKLKEFKQRNNLKII